MTMAARSQLMVPDEITQPPARDAGPQRLRTVVVDDDPDFLNTACELLEPDPRLELVARAEKGSAAMEAVLKFKPDLVLMDVHMPYLDGLTVTSFFAGRFPAILVVLMSSEDTPGLRAACKRSGAIAFVDKVNFQQEFNAVLRGICLGS
jgi:CheY-like chemotaxis protein